MKEFSRQTKKHVKISLGIVEVFLVIFQFIQVLKCRGIVLPNPLFFAIIILGILIILLDRIMLDDFKYEILEDEESIIIKIDENNQIKFDSNVKIVGQDFNYLKLADKDICFEFLYNQEFIEFLEKRKV